MELKRDERLVDRGVLRPALCGMWGRACNIVIQEIALNNNFTAFANSESSLERI